MKLSELRPCTVCGGNIVPLFYVVRITAAMVLPQAAHHVIELTEIMGGMANSAALHVAEALVSDPECVKILGDEERQLWTELSICQECFTTKDFSLPTLMGRATERKDARLGRLPPKLRNVRRFC
jgi:hypothetical protein